MKEATVDSGVETIIYLYSFDSSHMKLDSYEKQARSQDQFWGGAGSPKCGPFGPQKWTL